MKKIILLLVIISSFSVFATSRVEGLEKKINDKISFGMSQKELEKSIEKKSTRIVEGIVYYENLEDPIGLKKDDVSFMFDEKNGIVSSVYSKEMTLIEHRKILDKYVEFFKNVPNSKLKKMENLKFGIILYYNDEYLLEVSYRNGLNYITLQRNDSLENVLEDRIKIMKELENIEGIIIIRK